jgi:hypothetical protein
LALAAKEMARMRGMLHPYVLYLGIAADTLTFAGAILLARDAFFRLADLRDSRLDEEFRRRFSELPLADTNEAQARSSLKWARRGFAVVSVGFVCQILSRLAE